MIKLNQKGALPLIILISLLGVLVFIIVAASATFQDRIFGTLFPKQPSFAASDSTSYLGNNQPEIVTNKLPVATVNKYYSENIIVRDEDVGDSITGKISGLPEGLFASGCKTNTNSGSNNEWICSINGSYIGNTKGDFRVIVTINDNREASNSTVSKTYILSIK